MMNSDAIKMNSDTVGELDTRLKDLDGKAMANMVILADLQGKSNTNGDGVDMNSDEIKRL